MFSTLFDGLLGGEECLDVKRGVFLWDCIQRLLDTHALHSHDIHIRHYAELLLQLIQPFSIIGNTVCLLFSPNEIFKRQLWCLVGFGLCIACLQTASVYLSHPNHAHHDAG